MKRFSTFAVSLVFAAVMAVSVAAQTAPATGKIGWIDTAAFRTLPKIVNAGKALETEFKPRQQELDGLRTRMQTISTDLNKIQQQTSATVPFDERAAFLKQEEGEKLQREFNFKAKEAEVARTRREGELLAPIMETVYKSLDAYAKSKGYIVIIDVRSLGQANQASPILMMDASADITKDFITYYNAGQGSTATTAVPR